MLAIVATLIALLVESRPLMRCRNSVKGKKTAEKLFLSPTIIPGIVVGYSLYQFIVLKLKLPVMQGLLIGHFLVVLPYVIRVVGSALEQFDFSIEEMA